MSKILSIIIPIFNKWSFSKSCLGDLAQLPANSHEVIIIDNASTDETHREFEKYAKELYAKYPDGCAFDYVRNEENTFHSKACNQGFKLAVGNYVMFLNNDIRIKGNHAGWTESIIDACDKSEGLVGPTMGLLDKNLNFVKEANEQLSGNYSYLGGWCIAAREDVWYKLEIKSTNPIKNTHQIWDEELPFYFNDTDLSFRARKNNILLTAIDLPEVVHFGRVSARQINIPKLYNEGRQIFIKKWGKK